jgi:hypothetical protein
MNEREEIRKAVRQARALYIKAKKVFLGDFAFVLLDCGTRVDFFQRLLHG